MTDEERDAALRLGGIDLWLQQVQRVHYTPEYWTPEKAAALAKEGAQYGFTIGYEAAEAEQKRRATNEQRYDQRSVSQRLKGIIETI